MRRYCGGLRDAVVKTVSAEAVAPGMGERQWLDAERQVSRRVYLDDEIFAREMDRIFRNSWVYVGHESQVAHPGDYITTTLGTEPYILSRGESGQLFLLGNRCIHRGATVCQDERGNANFFRCLYHGWTYRNDGKLTGVPFPQGYGSSIQELRARGLERVEHVESRFGFVFAHAGTPDRTIDEHLAPAAPYLERFNASVPGQGVVLAHPPYRYRYDGNWKFQIENAVDGYHPSIVHLSFMKVVGRRTGEQSNPYKSDDGPVRVRALANGHMVLDLMKARTESLAEHRFGDSYLTRARMTPGGERLVDLLCEEIGAAAAAAALEADNDFNLVVFPNLMLIQSQVRTVTPVSVDRTIVHGWATVGRDAHPVVNQLRLRMQEVFNGPAGFGSPDDLEMFERVQAGLVAGTDDRLSFARGAEREVMEGEGGEVVVVGRGSDESPFRALYQEWSRLMEPDHG